MYRLSKGTRVPSICFRDAAGIEMRDLGLEDKKAQAATMGTCGDSFPIPMEI